MNETKKVVEPCPCGFGDVVIVAEDNDHLCKQCRLDRSENGWCIAEAAQYRKEYGDDWTVAQANCQREPVRQRLVMENGNKRRGWEW